MARRPRVFGAGLLYHVIARGNHRRQTFRRPDDYRAYLKRLAKYRQKFQVDLYAYCLMPNHVHLLLQTSQAPLAKFMQGLQQSYTQYFNRAHDQVGHLFQGRYKAILCEQDPYLVALIRYIHLNPVRAKLVKTPEGYPYCSHALYLAGKSTDVLDPSLGLPLFGSRTAYARFVMEGIKLGHQQEYYEVSDQQFLGSDDFRDRLKADRTEGEDHRVARRPLSSAFKVLAAHLKMDVDVLRGRDRSWLVSRARTLVGYTLVRRLGFRLTDLATYLRRDAATLSSLLTRFAERLHEDDRLKREVEKLTRIV